MKPLLSLSHICAAYNDKRVFDDVSLTVYENDFLGIVGPNGGGKTTLVRILLGLKKPVHGQVTYYREGKVVDDLSIGYLPQYSQIDRQFPISVREVVLSGLGAKKPLFRPFGREHLLQVDETLERLGLTELAKQHIAALSGGQLQRVLLARAIVSKPEMVVLDEPNTYMDKHSCDSMYGLLHDINSDCAVVVVSHEVEELSANAKNMAYVNHRLAYNDMSADF